jgi:methyl-accepting chemotaxis protein
MDYDNQIVFTFTAKDKFSKSADKIAKTIKKLTRDLSDLSKQSNNKNLFKQLDIPKQTKVAIEKLGEHAKKTIKTIETLKKKTDNISKTTSKFNKSIQQVNDKTSKSIENLQKKTENISKTAATVNKSIQHVNEKTSKTIETLKKNAVNISKTAATVNKSIQHVNEKTSKTIETLKKNTGDISKAVAKANKSIQRVNEKTSKSMAGISKTSKKTVESINEVGKQTKKSIDPLKNAGNGFQTLGKHTKDASRNVVNFNERYTNLMRLMSKKGGWSPLTRLDTGDKMGIMSYIRYMNVAAPILLAARKANVYSAEKQSLLTELRVIFARTNNFSQNMDKLQSKALKFSQTTPFSQKDYIKTVTSLATKFGNLDEALKFTPQLMKLGLLFGQTKNISQFAVKAVDTAALKGMILNLPLSVAQKKSFELASIGATPYKRFQRMIYWTTKNLDMNLLMSQTMNRTSTQLTLLANHTKELIVTIFEGFGPPLKVFAGAIIKIEDAINNFLKKHKVLTSVIAGGFATLLAGVFISMGASILSGGVGFLSASLIKGISMSFRLIGPLLTTALAGAFVYSGIKFEKTIKNMAASTFKGMSQNGSNIPHLPFPGFNYLLNYLSPSATNATQSPYPMQHVQIQHNIHVANETNTKVTHKAAVVSGNSTYNMSMSTGRNQGSNNFEISE